MWLSKGKNGKSFPGKLCGGMLRSMLFSISVTAGNERGPQHLEPLLLALHAASSRREPLELSFATHEGSVGLFAEMPATLQRFFAERMADAFPEGTLTSVSIGAMEIPAGWQVWERELWLTPDVFVLRTHEQFEHGLSRTLTDPVAGILSALRTGRSAPVRLTIRLSLRPATERRRNRARDIAGTVAALQRRRRSQLAQRYANLATRRSAAGRFVGWVLVRSLVRAKSFAVASEAETKLTGPLFEARLTLQAVAAPEHAGQAERLLQQVATAFVPFVTSQVRWRALRSRSPTRRRGFLLSVPEVATLWHPPTEMVRIAEMHRTTSRQLEPPVNLPTPNTGEDMAILGRLLFRRRREEFGIRLDDRRRHLAIVGKTGMGKSTLLLQLLSADIRAGRGVALIDPHGDLADSLLSLIPSRRTNDVVLFDAADCTAPIAFNPLYCSDVAQRPLVASGVLSAFKKLYGDSWGPRMEHIFRNGLLAVLEDRDASFFSVLRILSDARYRQRLIGRLQDSVVRLFWQDEFNRWKPQFQAEAIAPIQNKVGQFLSHPRLRQILGTPRSSLDLRRIMDEGRVLIVNLSQGRIGEDASKLLGSLLVTSLQQAAMSRADIPEAERRDFVCYIDEFQHFATESFATILSEARKYRLSLVLANQYLAQLDEATRHALFGNVGSLLAFQVGAADAETLAEEFAGEATPQDLLHLPKYTAYLRLLVDGLPSRPFSMQTLPPVKLGDARRGEIVCRTSRHRYGQRRDVERKPGLVDE